MQYVEVHGLENGADTKLGRICLDGGRLYCEPDTPQLRAMLEDPVPAPRGEGVYYPDTDPAGWLGCLCHQYRSAYRRCGEVKEDGDGDGGVKEVMTTPTD